MSAIHQHIGKAFVFTIYPDRLTIKQKDALKYNPTQEEFSVPLKDILAISGDNTSGMLKLWITETTSEDFYVGDEDELKLLIEAIGNASKSISFKKNND